jgi:FtsP/CotA-like multicopper oxidase with cupredoxin domain
MPARSHPRVVRRTLIAAALLAGAVAPGGAQAILPPPDAPLAAAAVQSIDLCATTGTVALPGAAAVPIWGFAPRPSAATPCDSVTAQLPGPPLEVAVGDTVVLNVTNAIPGHTISLSLPGIAVDAGPADAAPGATATVSFTATTPGTYLYSSSGDGGRQQAMGLSGALLVCGTVPCPSSGTHYGSAYDRSAMLVLGEIDPAFNAAPDTYDLRRWAPSYWLINGKARPDTADITAAAGERVLLRYLSAGPETVTMTMLGLHARLLARDAFRLDNPFDVVAETLPAGSTADMIATVPAGSAAGSAFPVYNRQLHLNNGGPANAAFAPAGGGGMMTFIRVPG